MSGLEAHALTLEVEDLENLVGQLILDGDLLGPIFPDRRVDELVAFPDVKQLLSEIVDGFYHAAIRVRVRARVLVARRLIHSPTSTLTASINSCPTMMDVPAITQ